MSAAFHRISVPALGVSVSASQSETILEALQSASVDYPCGCTSGVCGMCKSRLASGRVELADYCPAITQEERDAGLTLPCSARALSDCVITPIDDGLLPRVVTFAATVTAIAPLTHDIVRLRLAPPEGLRFTFLPGQYATLRFADLPSRDFSMANCPDDGGLEFFVRRTPGGQVTAYVFDALQPGESVGVTGPYGVAYLREGEVKPLIAVAGGSGLAPILSVVETALRRGFGQPIRLYFGVRSPRDLYATDTLATLAAAHPNLTVTRAVAEGGGPETRGGHIHAVIEADLAGEASIADWRAYVAGPPVMVDLVAKVLSAHGLAESRCHIDPFLTEADRAKTAGGPA
ncbi:2Fe-2S iron-sulfur cluster-binding protein [Acuticoccus mangrovi]|uniref:2Fe-2S iron-sulfur cluster binding domain-containing protein n=1 Tax=Acuticoccus mangrovi TaxID=2796142 RepID=A0A934MLL2_9HYPH|nr:2Fe-2S iron-sulfur cluster-binding protein [Acuticoccus mangrovi]MBJ3776474.1 2Fe-2S iron-sulfur cluster binding domain-containing protein [Acuticoccus mangrovi]